LVGSYLQFSVEQAQDRVSILEAYGHGEVRVNGEPRVGNPYETWYQLPILLRRGSNQLLFRIARDQFRGKLIPPSGLVYFAENDLTLPDWIRGSTAAVHAAVPIINATTESLNDLEIVAEVEGGEVRRTRVGPIPPVTLRKVGFTIVGPSHPESDAIEIRLKLVRSEAEDTLLDESSIQLQVREPRARHRRTFVSEIDGSVQYYALIPKQDTSEETPGGALYLALHGAGVEADGHAAVYAPKPDGVVVAPTNRRPFGFDWEDWGRRDALEVLDLAIRQIPVDTSRVYLTGHSMGGHGTWQIGATFPDRFAAIGPSAGWISFLTYGSPQSESNHPASSAWEPVQRSMSAGNTLILANNYAPLGIFVLHGDQDDNVPVDQAREMRKVLADFHTNFAYYERPDAGHWWGNECCDWPPMFEFFRRHSRPRMTELSNIDFTTVNPGVSASYGWATILGQTTCLAPSRIQLRLDREERTLQGTTENVSRLKLDLGAGISRLVGNNEVKAEMDGDALKLTGPVAYLSISNGRWQASEESPRREKGPHRYGPFKAAFDHRFVLVYGTKGNAAEKAWSLAKARYDAEQFWYRGNGSADLIPDTAFDAERFPNRNVILYGNSQSNTAWSQLLSDCPLQMTCSEIKLGTSTIEGDQLAALFIFPRPDSDDALVGVVGGTGIEGARATNSLRYFMSGVGYPDYVIFGADVLRHGPEAVRAAGYWTTAWKLD
jgi:poly(3-hydroxybutyrate) depolymerase